MAGITGGMKLDPGDLTLGAFIEYGDGSYDTHTKTHAKIPDAPSRIHGKGKAEYAGAGFLGRLDWAGTDKGHPYAEGSIRAGRLKNDFSAGFTLSSGETVPGQYDASASYYSLHLGTGHVWTLADESTLDVYVKYFHARRGSDRTRIDTPNGGNKLRLDAIESHRLRIGARHTGDRNSGHIQPYWGLAYEHEFNGKAKASLDGISIPHAPDLKGGTGIAEIGLTVAPSPGQPVSVDLGFQAYTGKREGMSGSLKLEYRF
jgi:outer membrane autotransporter protein